MQILSNVSLKQYNTFGINVSAKLFCETTSVEQIKTVMQTTEFKTNNKLILGGGSNVLFTKNVDALVIKNTLKGITVTNQINDDVYVKCASGEVWHEFVMWCIQQNFAGLENLSLIPGCTGASPMQNIGAYGAEIKDVFYELEALHIETGLLKTFTKSDCNFGYRESVFKHQFKNQFIITSVTFKLSKKPNFNIEYGAIKQELDKMNITNINIKAISQAVINIRTSKLPNPKEIGNAGSFFKNPEVTEHTYQQLMANFANIVAYPLANKNYKLAAGWLIEQAGLKGYRVNDAGVHNLQALVLVNYGNATGNELYDLSTHILNTVNTKFGVMLEREVNVI